MWARYVITLFCLPLLSCQDKQQQANHLKELSINSIEKGDILFRRGESMASHVVISTDKSGHYSHIGIAVEYQGQLMVAHAIPNESEYEYIRIDSIEQFFDDSNAAAGAITRMPLNDEEKRRINNYALQLATSKIPFDHEYNTDDPNKLYCTEYIWAIFKTIDKDITCGKRKTIQLIFAQSDIILPSHIFQNPQLIIISTF